jgi:DNA helicase HerA-like ATPase
MMNRHGLVAGATGTGKTVTLHMMAEQLSIAGVPVFLADIKGDLSGLATAATASEKLTAGIQFLTSDEGKAELEGLGGLSKATAGVILRELVNLEAQGMEKFFGEPEFDTAELLRTAPDGW